MKTLRKILLPFSWIYAAVIGLRNIFFDWGLFPSKSYDIPVITVGNLSVGGTGKTPMIEYLMRLLKDDHEIATLSRGYKRETSGFHLLEGDEMVKLTGDEPLQFKTKFPNNRIAVAESRQKGIKELRKLSPPPEIILLDDAFQHRKVKPGLSILMTTYDKLYTKDVLLPAGNLREPKSGADRADIVVVSKCPQDLTAAQQVAIENELQLKSYQRLFFSYIAYADYLTNGQSKMPLGIPEEFCLVTGIANPTPLVSHLKQRKADFLHSRFSDHHNFTKVEIETLKKEPLVVTTEKDFMRLKEYLSLDKLFYIPIKQEFVTNKFRFDREILNAVKDEEV